MSVRAPVGDINITKERCSIGRGLAAINSKIGCASFLFYTMLELKFELNKFNDEGTVFGSITKDDLFTLPILSLSDDEQKEFEDKIAPLDRLIYTNEKEIMMLKNMRSLLLKKLTAKTAKLSFIFIVKESRLQQNLGEGFSPSGFFPSFPRRLSISSGGVLLRAQILKDLFLIFHLLVFHSLNAACQILYRSSSLYFALAGLVDGNL